MQDSTLPPFELFGNKRILGKRMTLLGILVLPKAL